jgi:hypothetical protein
MLSRLDVRELYERSTHGKSNRCDKIGEIVKVRFVEVTRLGELLARNKAVHAFVAQKIEANVDMQLQMDPTLRQRARRWAAAVGKPPSITARIALARPSHIRTMGDRQKR